MENLKAWAMGEANRHKEPMVFDWIKAANIIKERNPEIASAGLKRDWGSTGGCIWDDGKPFPRKYKSTYLASTWASPQLRIDDEDMIDCYKMQSEVPEWTADTFWPEEALKIIIKDQLNV